VNEPTLARDDELVVDPLMDALWSRALEAWDDDKVHLALLDHAMRAQALPELAGRYRVIQDSGDEAKGPMAKKRLDAIVVAATHMLFAMKTPGREKLPRSITYSAVGICVFMVSLVAYAILHGR
jgi:hypothetical protein